MKHRMTDKVVITGMGCISALGLDTAAYWNALCNGRSAISPLENVSDNLKIKTGATIGEFQPREYFKKDELILLDRSAQFAVVAAREALGDAKLDKDQVHPAAVIIGTGAGAPQYVEEAYDLMYRQQKTHLHPLTVPRTMPCLASSMTSMLLGTHGPAFSVSSACASGAHAIALGYMMIKSGLVERAFVGGTEAPFTEGILRAWEALRIISPDTCRPFCEDRSGTVLGEGSGMLVIESEKEAQARDARIYGEIAGCGMTSDASHITLPDVESISAAIREALDRSGIHPAEIDYVNAHGTATQANDLIETKALHEVFGESAQSLMVSSTKSMHGHALGASSALELIATLLAIKHQTAPPTANFTRADAKCDLDYVPNVARESSIRSAISNSFAFGGLNVVLAVRRT